MWLSIATCQQRHIRGAVLLAFAASILAAPAQPAVAADAKASALETADQRTVESLALKLVASPEVKKQREETVKRFLADPAANTPDGKKTLQNAVDELAFVAAFGAANEDPARPKVVWAFFEPQILAGRKIPGSRFAIDNPDNVYRFVTVDGASRYEITVHPKQPGPVQFSFLLYDTYAGEDTKQSGFLDSPIDGLRDRDIKAEPDGSFKITIDSDPAGGRANHIRSNADARNLLIRNTLSDWEKQSPPAIEIKRVGGPEPAELASEKELARRAAYLLKAATDSLFRFKNISVAKAQTNAFSNPIVRGGGWGFATFASFRLADDEALLVTLDPLGAQYLGFDLTDPWLVSREHIRANGSLNNLQARPNKDGSYTYVVSARNPGIFNWLDTGGLHEGAIMLRWQAVPETIKSADNAVREVKVVKLAELPSMLPEETVKVEPEQRKTLYAQRAQAYAHRYRPD